MRTVVGLKISQAAYNEIAGHLREHEYHHCFLSDGGIDMSGIAVLPDPDRAFPPGIVEVDARNISRDAFRELYSLGTTGNTDNEA
ncbi:hypothetical protein [Bradyrhizobium retamae]|uniref:Uncharacterized protein n=1 Tax=Bradyrhizobium retamae TaxID=1300035 RepID=A0A0R3MPP5_9BRAD|nr:hypothetical protein [Bradyrhizobium retamae]KRR21676.1 hypothetical protein CQ13_06395 [Bradyrhizobium retamae]